MKDKVKAAIERSIQTGKQQTVIAQNRALVVSGIEDQPEATQVGYREEHDHSITVDGLWGGERFCLVFEKPSEE